MERSKGSPYEVDALAKGLDLLDALSRQDGPIRLCDLSAATRIHKTTVFRLLRTMERRGWLERVGQSGYRPLVVRRRPGRFRLAYASRDERLAFPRAVTGSLLAAAHKEGAEVLVLDNRSNRRRTIRNVESIIQAQVDLAVEFTTDVTLSAEIAARLTQAGIPLIAVDQPMPGAFFFGADNYNAGFVLGRALGVLAGKKKSGLDQVVLIKDGGGGPIISARLTGALAGMQQSRPRRGTAPVYHLDGKGTFEGGLRAMRGHLRTWKATGTLVVVAMNDPSVLGAIHAIEEAGAGQRSIAAAVGGGLQVRQELRRPGTPLAAVTTLFPEGYGRRIIDLALAILGGGERVPPAAFTPHQVLTPGNVDHVYPNDSLCSNE
jgi:ribose transport system substrate-binding protein